jgi:hypothetical protein
MWFRIVLTIKHVMKPVKNHVAAVLIFFQLFLFCACEDSAIDSPSDFFPLGSSREWHYERWISFDISHPQELLFDTLHLRIGGEMVVDGQTYSKIERNNGMIDKIVRKEGQKYFARNHELYLGFTHEYIFLDADKGAGDSWSYVKDEGSSMTEYLIMEKNVTKTIMGKTYENVIVVKVNYYLLGTNGAFEPLATAFHYYAAGIGEIYNFYPYPVSKVYGNLSAFITESD